MTPPTRMEIWALCWFVAALIMSGSAQRFFSAGHVAAGVASVVVALLFLMVSVFLVRHRLHRSQRNG
jgi:divalent metal cation (Fe/Co/Zn/Cd) transporter